MRRRIKKSIALVLLIGCSLSFGEWSATPALAAEKGTVTNPIQFGTGGTFQKIWYPGNDHLDVYGNFTMSNRGYVTIGATKPTDDEGETCGYDIYIYTLDGALVWTCDTDGQKNIPTPSYKYEVGLNSGEYILRFNPSFYVESGNVESTLSVNTSASTSWEIEDNNSFSKATLINIGKKITGVYGENTESGEPDYFKFKLKKGKRYSIKIGNYDKLFSDTVICEMYDPRKKEIDAGCIEETGHTTIKAKYSGYYYIKFRNEFGEGWKYTILVKKK